MSTVLRPVGPLPPRVYWVRRGVLLAAVIIVILIIAVSCSGGGGGNPSAGPRTSPTSTPRTSASVAACQPTSLRLHLSTDKPTYAVGASATLTGTFTNRGATSCKLTTSPQNETWKITSGTATTWSNKSCTRSALAKSTTLAPSDQTTVSITWNGEVVPTGCASGDQATPGHYIVHATLDGVTAKKDALFQITTTGQ